MPVRGCPVTEKSLPTEYRLNGRTYKPHPAADCFPLLTGSSFLDLVDDVRSNGIVQPVLLLGEFVLDGRNRALAAEEVGLSKVPTRELNDGIDACAFVASLNIHRRHLTSTQRSNAAANLMELVHQAYLANYPDEPDPDKLPRLDGGQSSSDGSAESAEPESSGVAGVARASSPDSLSADSGVDPAVLAEVTDDQGKLTVGKMASAADVSPGSLHLAGKVRAQCPDLGDAMRDDLISLNDAARIQYEPSDVRRQAVDDVREGRAATAARAIRQRFQRDPVQGPDASPVASDAQPPPQMPDDPGELTVSPSLLASVRAILGGIDFDPCSADWCADRIGAETWHGTRDDGLLVEWSGRVWVFPPLDRADPFISKTLFELESGRITAAALLVPVAPWADATKLALASSFLRCLVVPSSPVTCRRPNGASVCPEEPLWLIVLGTVGGSPLEVFRSFASAVLKPEDFAHRASAE